ncbi:unnamed protein product [Linum trigynum]|uniref:Uncharacterized protein n=1 Tax=Linum trigynum TaxID=586398 RepID=A0AAV2F9D4_9ROSI
MSHSVDYLSLVLGQSSCSSSDKTPCLQTIHTRRSVERCRRVLTPMTYSSRCVTRSTNWTPDEEPAPADDGGGAARQQGLELSPAKEEEPLMG